MGTQTQLILEEGEGAWERCALPLWAQAGEPVLCAQPLLADSGFDGAAVEEGDLISPIRRGGDLLAPKRRAQAELVDQARLDGLYGQR